MRLLMICSAITLLSACNSKKDIETNKDVIVTDTTGLYKSNVSTDTAVVTEPVEQAPPTVIRDTKIIYVDRTPSTKNVRKTIPKQGTQSNNQTQSNNNTANSNTQANSSGTTGTTGTANTPTTKPAEDKGWKNSTKGAVIGGVGGAVVGAVVSKKKGKGAIIGGVLGAAGGYILGKKKDKADTTR